MTIAFNANEEIQIVGFSRECECSHCGRELKVGVKLAGFAGVFGADCLARAIAPQQTPYTVKPVKLAADTIKTRAIVIGKGAEYAYNQYGWKAEGPVFKMILKTALKSV